MEPTPDPTTPIAPSGPDPRHLAMGLSLGAAVLMLVGKMTAFWITGSTAIFSDALESVIHIVATGIAAYSLYVSNQPADRDHPYGHGKVAYFSAGFEGALILIASVTIIVVAAIMQVTGVWNDYILGLVFAGRDHLPMTVQLNNVINTTTGVRQYNVNMAATILTAAVPLAVYFISGRWFVRGIAAGAVKG